MSGSAPEFPVTRENPLHPPHTLTSLRTQGHAARVSLWDGRRVWLITGYDAARTALRDRRFSSDASNPAFPRLSASFLVGAERGATRNFSRMDEPAHSALRRMVAQPFSTRAVAARREEIETIVVELLDEMEDRNPPVDLVSAFAAPLPTKMICMLLGVPYQDQDYFREQVTIAIITKDIPAEAARRARAELIEYLDTLVGAKIANGGDDLISHLVRHYDSDLLSRPDLVTMAWLMLVAGYETTSCMISLSVFSILTDPDLAHQLRESPELLPDIIEELSRFHTVVKDGVPRVAVDDVQLGECRIHKGDGVIISLAAANRDPSAFDDPDRIDIHRPRIREHLAFGTGPHQCLGGTLANLELQIALSALFTRFPGLRLAVPPEHVDFRTRQTIHGLHQLPVQW